MAVVLKSEGLAWMPPNHQDDTPGRFLKSFDLEAHDGRGATEWTRDIGSAHKFSDFTEALSTWKAQSKRHPVRPDGKPNRPLTAYTVSVETV